jgi:hypothetical protein
MVDVRVDAAVGDETEEVDAGPPLLRPLECLGQRLVLEECTGLDRVVDALKVLEEDSPRPDRQVPDLGVAHLAFWETDGRPRGFQRRVRVAAPELVEDRRGGQLDPVTGTGRCAAPPVQDDQGY